MAEREYLAHFGIKGMRWGIRRFQNEDGSLTNAGRNRYGEGGEGKKVSFGNKFNNRSQSAAGNRNLPSRSKGAMPNKANGKSHRAAKVAGLIAAVGAVSVAATWAYRNNVPERIKNKVDSFKTTTVFNIDVYKGLREIGYKRKESFNEAFRGIDADLARKHGINTRRW